eukprot:m.477670 g.477670  ORF g.477670 m.477670 type:complete len:71 (-) comp44346_c0_seq1:68-280(-)
MSSQGPGYKELRAHLALKPEFTDKILAALDQFSAINAWDFQDKTLKFVKTFVDSGEDDVQEFKAGLKKSE